MASSLSSPACPPTGAGSNHRAERGRRWGGGRGGQGAAAARGPRQESELRPQTRTAHASDGRRDRLTSGWKRGATREPSGTSACVTPMRQGNDLWATARLAPQQSGWSEAAAPAHRPAAWRDLSLGEGGPDARCCLGVSWSSGPPRVRRHNRCNWPSLVARALALSPHQRDRLPADATDAAPLKRSPARRARRSLFDDRWFYSKCMQHEMRREEQGCGQSGFKVFCSFCIRMRLRRFGRTVLFSTVTCLFMFIRLTVAF